MSQPDTDIIKIAQDAAAWARGSERSDDCLVTRDLLNWAFVDDPVRWNAAAKKIGGIHPDFLAVEILEPVAPGERLAPGLPISAQVADALAIAGVLASKYTLRPTPTLLAYASLFAKESFANAWARQKVDLFNTAGELAELFFGSPLAELSDSIDLSDESMTNTMSLTSEGMRRRYRSTFVGFLVTAIFVHFAFRLAIPFAIFIAWASSFAIPNMSEFQTRRRLSLAEVIGIAFLAVTVILVVGAIRLTITDAKALTKLTQARADIRERNPKQAFTSLQELQPQLGRFPAVRMVKACALNAMGYKDASLLEAQFALLLDYPTVTAPGIPDCFVNRIDRSGQPRIIRPSSDNRFIVPADDLDGWVARAQTALDQGRLIDELFDIACAHHVVGNRLTAAAFLTLGLARLPVDLTNDDPIRTLANSNNSQVTREITECLNLVGTSGKYQRIVKGQTIVMRPADYREREP